MSNIKDIALKMFHDLKTGKADTFDFWIFCWDNNLDPDKMEAEYWETDMFENEFLK